MRPPNKGQYFNTGRRSPRSSVWREGALELFENLSHDANFREMLDEYIPRLIEEANHRQAPGVSFFHMRIKNLIKHYDGLSRKYDHMDSYALSRLLGYCAGCFVKDRVEPLWYGKEPGTEPKPTRPVHGGRIEDSHAGADKSRDQNPTTYGQEVPKSVMDKYFGLSAVDYTARWGVKVTKPRGMTMNFPIQAQHAAIFHMGDVLTAPTLIEGDYNKMDAKLTLHMMKNRLGGERKKMKYDRKKLIEVLEARKEEVGQAVQEAYKAAAQEATGLFAAALEAALQGKPPEQKKVEVPHGLEQKFDRFDSIIERLKCGSGDTVEFDSMDLAINGLLDPAETQVRNMQKVAIKLS